MRNIKLRDTMQRSLRIDTIPEAIPVMLVIGRLVAIAFTILAVKMFSFIKYRHYFDDMVLLHRDNIPPHAVPGLFLLEMPLTTFPYNLIVAFVLYKIVDTYNTLIEGVIKSLTSLGQLLDTEFPGLEKLRKYKLSKIPVILAAYNAFFRIMFLVPILLYMDYKTRKGCQEIAKFMTKGVSAVIDRNLNVIMRSDLMEISSGDHPILSKNYGIALATLLANVVLSIPSAVRIHKIIRRVNKTLRVCRGTVDPLASALVMLF